MSPNPVWCVFCKVGLLRMYLVISAVRKCFFLSFISYLSRNCLGCWVSIVCSPLIAFRFVEKGPFIILVLSFQIYLTVVGFKKKEKKLLRILPSAALTTGRNQRRGKRPCDGLLNKCAEREQGLLCSASGTGSMQGVWCMAYMYANVPSFFLVGAVSITFDYLRALFFVLRVVFAGVT